MQEGPVERGVYARLRRFKVRKPAKERFAKSGSNAEAA